MARTKVKEQHEVKVQVPQIAVHDLPTNLQSEVLAWREQLQNVPVGCKFFYTHIVGTTPLLMHRFVNDNKKGKRNYDPAEEAEKATYRNSQGILCIPDRNIIGLLRDTVSTYRWAKSQKEFKETFMLSLFKVVPEMIPVVKSDGTLATDYEIHGAGVIHSPKAGRVMEWRPMLRDWGLHFVVIMWQGIISDEEIGGRLLAVLSQGGIHIGIGDFRGLVNKSGLLHYTGGEYGRFKVVQFYEVV